ncbi:hypothetical protein [Neosynechococcus sphagnicola]|nr:hypothetical protein [Neosynechococcus sphagnicola]
MNETEGQDIERQLTPQELEGIAGGGAVDDFLGEVGGSRFRIWLHCWTSV